MERAFQSQLEEISGKIEELVSEEHTNFSFALQLPSSKAF